MDENKSISLEVKAFVIRVLKGECSPQETAILPEILKMYANVDPIKMKLSTNDGIEIAKAFLPTTDDKHEAEQD